MKIPEKLVLDYQKRCNELEKKYNTDSYSNFGHIVSGFLFNLGGLVYGVQDGINPWEKKRGEIILKFKLLRYYLREFEEDSEFREDESKRGPGHLGITRNIENEVEYLQKLKEHYHSRKTVC